MRRIWPTSLTSVLVPRWLTLAAAEAGILGAKTLGTVPEKNGQLRKARYPQNPAIDCVILSGRAQCTVFHYQFNQLSCVHQ